MFAGVFGTGMMRDKGLNSKGFSIIELIVIVVVIGVLAAIGFPTLMGWLPNYRLKAAAQEVYGNMQKARLEAVKSNTDVTATYDVCPTVNGEYSFTNVKSGQVVASGRFNTNICITAGPTVNGFTSRGLPTTGAVGNVVLEHSKISRTYTIQQTLAGAIRLQ